MPGNDLLDRVNIQVIADVTGVFCCQLLHVVGIELKQLVHSLERSRESFFIRKGILRPALHCFDCWRRVSLQGIRRGKYY